MPGESLQHDLGEVVEYYGVDEILGLSAPDVAKFLERCLDALKMTVFAKRLNDPNTTHNSEVSR